MVDEIMKVTFVFTASLRTLGGVSVWASEVIPRLYNKGVNVKVFASTFVDGFQWLPTIRNLLKHNIPYRELKVARLTSKMYVIPYISNSLKELFYEMSTTDIVYIQNPFIGQAEQLLLISKRAKVPTIVGYHSSLLNNKLLHDYAVIGYLHNIWRKFNIHHVLTPYQAKILKLWGFKNIYIIPNGVDVQRYAKATRKNDKKHLTVLYIGRLTLAKNVHILLEVAKDFYLNGIKNVYFRFAGEGQLSEVVKAYSRKFRNIIYEGLVLGDEKVNLYRSAHICVLPSQIEGLPLTLLEAMASGCFIIATSKYGVIPRGNIILRPLTKETLKNALTHALKLFEKGILEQIAIMNHEVAQKFDWEIITDRILSMLKESYNN